MKDGNNFCIAVSKPCLSILVCLYSNTTLLELQTLLFLFFSKICASKLGVRLIYGCGLYTDVYGIKYCSLNQLTVIWFQQFQSNDCQCLIPSRLRAASLFSSVSHVRESVSQLHCKTQETRVAAREEKRETARTARANEISVGLTTQKYDWLMRDALTTCKLSTMETIDKLIMAKALQESLLRFPKIDTLKAEQSEALEALITGRDVIAIVPTGFGKSLIFQLFCEIKLVTNPNTWI